MKTKCWRTRLTVHKELHKEALTAYNKMIRLARQDDLSSIITENTGNPRMLFSTIDRLLNTAPAPPQSSAAKCEEFETFLAAR